MNNESIVEQLKLMLKEYKHTLKLMKKGHSKDFVTMGNTYLVIKCLRLLIRNLEQ